MANAWVALHGAGRSQCLKSYSYKADYAYGRFPLLTTATIKDMDSSGRPGGRELVNRDQ